MKLFSLNFIKHEIVGTQVKTLQGLSCGMGSKPDLLSGISLLAMTWSHKLTDNSLNEIQCSFLYPFLPHSTWIMPTGFSGFNLTSISLYKLFLTTKSLFNYTLGALCCVLIARRFPSTTFTSARACITLACSVPWESVRRNHISKSNPREGAQRKYEMNKAHAILPVMVLLRQLASQTLPRAVLQGWGPRRGLAATGPRSITTQDIQIKVSCLSATASFVR